MDKKFRTPHERFRHPFDRVRTRRRREEAGTHRVPFSRFLNIRFYRKKEAKQILAPRGSSGYPVEKKSQKIFLDPKNDGESDSGIPVAVSPRHRGVNELQSGVVVFKPRKGPVSDPLILRGMRYAYSKYYMHKERYYMNMAPYYTHIVGTI